MLPNPASNHAHPPKWLQQVPISSNTSTRARGTSLLETLLLDYEAGSNESTGDNSKKNPFEVAAIEK